MAGRNDDYGYKPIERAYWALELWAQQLDDGDELIFVDANSGGITLPERVNTVRSLSASVKKKLRVLKITPETHATFEVKVPMAEYHAKNVGVRNAKGEWIICTNTDDFPVWSTQGMRQLQLHPETAFVPGAVKRIPVIDWTAADSVSQMLATAALIKERGIWKPGDFQMMPRETWYRVRAYEESLKYWGYNDSLLTQKTKFTYLPQEICTVYHLEHKTAQHPARGWEYDKNHERDESLQHWKETINDEDWGTAPFEEIVLG
jgi:hypothetical protein